MWYMEQLLQAVEYNAKEKGFINFTMTLLYTSVYGTSPLNSLNILIDLRCQNSNFDIKIFIKHLCA